MDDIIKGIPLTMTQYTWAQGGLDQIGSIALDLLTTNPLYGWAELERNNNLPPAVSGIYAWFFKEIPHSVPIDNCLQRNGMKLLYVGISPSKPGSRETLRSRIRFHYRNHAEGSTLRLTLGCLLESKLKTVLRRVGSGKRMTFGLKKEDDLTIWMANNAFVTWVELDKPWRVEPMLIEALRPPLNIESNNDHPFHSVLKQLRLQARRRARTLPILR